ncbi:MAG: IS4 family transposase [bacterium]|nr:IS4 family transposase [bacterium]
MCAINIGNMREYTVKNMERYGITPFRRILPPDIFLKAYGKYVRSSTILIPEVVFWLMTTVSLTKISMAGSITAFWATFRSSLPFLCPAPVTEEAFCTARKKLRLGFFRAIFRSVVQRYQEHYDDRFRWKGFRLLGVDGMKMKLPAAPRLMKYFSPASNQRGKSKSAQGLIVGLVGLFNGICYDFRLTSSKGSEQDCARQLINRFIGQGDLLMCDRNFPDYHTLALLMFRRANYLFRLPSKRFHNFERTATASGRKDEWYITLLLPKKLARQHPDLPAEFTARIIQYQRDGFRPSLLITSLLDTEIYGHDELANLYHERWRQETMHSEWKYSLSLANLRSITIRGIYKEVYTQLTINNVVRWLMTEGAELADCRPVDLKFLDCKRMIISYAHAMSVEIIEILPNIYCFLIKDISQQKILVRPGRSYPRKNENKPRNKGNGYYVKPARLSQDERKGI